MSLELAESNTASHETGAKRTTHDELRSAVEAAGGEPPLERYDRARSASSCKPCIGDDAFR
jgi:hypothetical protein